VSGCDAPQLSRDDDGFTLIEVVVAFALLVVVMTSALPVFIRMLQATAVTKAHTQAKNLAQERLDQMRDLRFHVDRQNGPFLDLLDIYFTNATSASPVTTVNAGSGTLTGSYIATGAASGGEPAAPFYRVTTGPIPGATSFSQIIDTQFLGPDGSAVPAARFQDVYDSQIVGRDQSPSLMVGVTVLTTWTSGGKVKTFRTYTRVTDGRPQAPVIQSQGRAVAVDITSNGADTSTLELQAGLAKIDGAQSSGSSVSGYVTGALATRTGVTPVTGKVEQFSLPSQGVTTSGSGVEQSLPSCSWWGFGKTDTNNVTGDVSAGLPKSPTNVNGATPFNTASGFIAANSGGGCGLLSYDNTAGGGIPRLAIDPVGFSMGAKPYVRVNDTTGGSAPAITGRGYVTSNPLPTSPQQTKAGAAVAMAAGVTLFPNNPESSFNNTLGSKGLVGAILDQGSVDCVSGTSGVDGTIVGKYTLHLFWWGKGLADASARWHQAMWTYDSSLNAAPVPAVGAGWDTWDPANTFLSTGQPLSNLVQGPAVPNVVKSGANNGLRGFPTGIFTLTTAPTLVNETSPGFSAINVQLGQLSCVADDQR
jgi:prepilin-type N-terminal cleavage/methylation domain-containing protein